MSGKRKASTPDVVVLGASGMLGAMVVDVLAQDGELRVAATVREAELGKRFGALYPGVAFALLDAERADDKAVAAAIGGARFVVNAIGMIKQHIHDDRADEVERAIQVNSLFPHRLGRVAANAGARILQIATDCVYAGIQGGYAERARHDAIDVYGKTKSLGEAQLAGVHSLRCSIIGPEPKGFVSLLEWFLGQPREAHVKGFANHRWNGVTTLQFARLCRGVVREQLSLPRLQHIVPTGTVSKAEMLACFATVYCRDDIAISVADAADAIDRTLTTENAALNAQLWRAAGYATPPTVPEMIAELGARSCSWQRSRS